METAGCKALGLSPVCGARPDKARVSDRSADPLWSAAQDLETTLVAELFTYAGVTDAVSGETGLGGQAFSNLAVEAYAEKFVAGGGLGISEKIYRQLLRERQ